MPFLSPGDLPNPGIAPSSPALEADSLLTGLQGNPEERAVGSYYLMSTTFLFGKVEKETNCGNGYIKM